MTKKNVIIAILGAVVLGALLGLAIGFVGGFVGGNDEEQISVSEQKTTVEEEKAQKQEKEDAAKKAAKEVADDKEKASDVSDNEEEAVEENDQTDAEATNDSKNKKSQNKDKAEGMGSVTVATNGADLNLRAADDTNSDIVGAVHNGDVLTVIAESNGMYQVETPDGQTAWVSSQFVTMN